jgi:hypothetical protein
MEDLFNLNDSSISSFSTSVGSNIGSGISTMAKAAKAQRRSACDDCRMCLPSSLSLSLRF